MLFERISDVKRVAMASSSKKKYDAESVKNVILHVG